VQRQQIADILERVINLGIGEGPPPPVGALFTLGRSLAEELCHRTSIRGGKLGAAKAGGDLRVEKIGRRLPTCEKRKIHFFAGGMGNCRVIAFGKRPPKIDQVAGAIGVNHGQLAFRGDLHQAQFGPIRVLRDKLRIDADPLGAGETSAEFGERGGRCNCKVGHGERAGVSK
jgi:hypothetical protein